jgi:outer membrane protein OmpA-like peptidoglycan-associated protein/tetratricopeptide (TPR) repeat protein
MDSKVKRLLKASLVLALAGAGVAPALGQSTRKALSTANKFYENENYRASIPFYEQVLAKEPDNALALFRCGISYMSFDKEKASDYIYKAQRLKPKVSKDVEYWLGRVDHINYNFDDAITHYQSYATTLKKKNDPRKEEVALRIQHSKNAKVQFNNPKDIFVKNLGPVINTIASEHSPVISADDKLLLYTSRGSNVTAADSKKGIAADGEYYEDIFEAKRIGDDQWDTPRSLSGVLNGKGHDASIQVFDNDTKMLMYRQDEDGDIFYTQKENNEWTEPKKLNKNINTKRFQSDAFITPDGKTLYFSTSEFSDNNTLDLYYSTRPDGGDWGAPQSLGNTVNTAYDDDSPFLSRDGKTLYFSSRGHDTMGGYDIFKSTWDEGSKRWGKPVNMGYPVNTPDDDTYYRLSPDGSYAYLSSYRIGGYGEKDIYTINYIKNATIKGRVFALRDSSAVPGAELVFNSQSADKKAISFRDVTKPDSGTYSVNVLSGRSYQVNISKDGKLITTEAFEVPMVTQDSAAAITKDFYVTYVDSAAIKAEIAARDKSFKTIYYTTDQYDLRPESITELDKIVRVLKANPTINLSVEGHTDKRNSDSYNMSLGKNRSVSAYKYLVDQGIDAKRLVTISYGERRPAAPNDTEENMQLNRRSEFRVILKKGQTLKDLNLTEGISKPGTPGSDAASTRIAPGQKGRQKKR